MQRQEIPQLSEMPFQTIYRSAKEIVSMLNGENRRKKEQILAAFLAAGHCVDVHQGLETPISRLASENNEAAVDLLHYRFGANIGNAITGYAYGNHVKKVMQLANTEERKECAALGYAFSGNHTEMLKLKVNYELVVVGYACGGWDEEVGYFATLYSSYLNYAIIGCALGGRTERVKELLEQYPNVMCSDGGLIGAYARGGFVRQVNDLRAMRPIPDYAVAGMKQYGPDGIALLSYAIGGHFAQVNQLLYGPSQLCKNVSIIRHLFHEYAKMGRIDEVCKLNDSLADFNSSELAIAIYQGNLSCDYLNFCIVDALKPDSILCTLTSIQNPVLLNGLVKIIKMENLEEIKMYRKYNNYFHKFDEDPNFPNHIVEPELIDVKQLLIRSIKLNQLMNTYAVDYQRALSLEKYPKLQGLINHFGLSYDQALSILKEPGLIGFFQYCHWLEQQQGIALSDIIALCTSFTAGLAHEDAKNLYRISIKTGFFSRSLAHQKQRPDDQPGQKGNKIKHTLSHVLNRFKKH